MNLSRRNHYIALGVMFISGTLLCSKVFYRRNLDNFLIENSKGVPYYNEKKNLIDLNRTYFFLDDDNDFKPSLWYHGRVNGFSKPDGLL